MPAASLPRDEEPDGPESEIGGQRGVVFPGCKRGTIEGRSVCSRRVPPVEGTRDPREGRLVVHGWFVQPRPFVEGPLPASAVAARVGDLGAELARALGGLPVAGLLSLGISVRPGGRVGAVRVLSDTTRAPAGREAERRRLVARLRGAVARWDFPRRAAPSRVTLPLVFERGS